MTVIQSKKFLSEILDEANKADSPSKVLSEAIKADGRVMAMLGYLANPKFKLDFPEGFPPYRQTDDALGTTTLDCLRLKDKMYVLFNTQTPRRRREEIFIQWLEQMAEPEAKVLVAIKDKSLVEFYPNLTEYVVVDGLGWSHEEYNKLKA
jgi:hypothetical protein